MSDDPDAESSDLDESDIVDVGVQKIQMADGSDSDDE